MIPRLLRIKQTSHLLQSGNILIAVPFMGDPYFERSIVLLIDHNEEGSFGIVLNKKISMFPLKFVKPNLKKKLHLYNGGPVEPDHLFFLHTYGDLLENNIPMTEEVSFGGKEYDLISLMKADLLDQNSIRFYIGYAGWGAGQLEEEIKDKRWVIGQFKKELVFPENMHIWRKAVADLGKDYAHWLLFADKVYYN